MFDLDISDETVAVVSLCRSLGIDVLDPAAKASERSASVPDDVRRALFETGLTTPVDERFGGGGRPSAQTRFAAVEALAYGDPGLAMAAVWSGAAASVIGAVGTPAQQEALLPAFASDVNAHGALALYEGFGRAPSESATTVSKTAGGWAVKGTKLAVAGAATADPIVVVGTDPADGRIRVAMVRPGQAGVTITEPEGHIGLDAAQLSTVVFDCTVTDDSLMGGAEPDPNATQIALSELRLMNAAALLGTAQRAVAYASKYATERIAFGKPISAFQGVSFLLADASIRIAAARVEVVDVAARIDAGAIDNLEARVTESVNYSGAVSTQATRDAIQVLGGHGFITDHPVELWYRSAAALASLDFDPLCSTFEPSL
jgi:alkylation response protein AidB-like acyl-CoA dehydrogenase